MTAVNVWGRVDELTDGTGGSLDAVIGAAIGPYRKSGLGHGQWNMRNLMEKRSRSKNGTRFESDSEYALSDGVVRSRAGWIQDLAPTLLLAHRNVLALCICSVLASMAPLSAQAALIESTSFTASASYTLAASRTRSQSPRRAPHLPLTSPLHRQTPFSPTITYFSTCTVMTAADLSLDHGLLGLESSLRRARCILKMS